MQLLAISVTQWFSHQNFVTSWNGAATHSSNGRQKASLEKNRGISGVNGFAAFLTEDRKEKNKTVWCFFVYIYKAVYFRAKKFKQVVFNIASSIASCFTS